MGCILASVMTICSSYFAMWCILDNCLAREKVSRVLNGNNGMMIFFLPSAKKYATKYRITYCVHSILYCLAMIRILYIVLLIYLWMNGLFSIPTAGCSFAYLLWCTLILGLSMGQSALWDLRNDSQNENYSGKPLGEKGLCVDESLERLTKAKQTYQTHRDHLTNMQTCSHISRRKRKKLLLDMVIDLQMIQIWTWYTAKTHDYFSKKALKQGVNFILNEWKQLQGEFDKVHLIRDFERYTDCIIVRSKYLPTLHEAETAVSNVSIEYKAKCLDRFSDEMSLMLERICNVYEKFDEISYPCKTELNPVMNDIIHAMEVCEVLSGQISAELHKKYVDWFCGVKDEFNKLGIL